MSLLRILGKLRMIQVSLNEIIASMPVDSSLQKIERKSKQIRSKRMNASDIATFFSTSTKAKNDITSRLREKVLTNIMAPPKEWLDDPEYGPKWIQVSTEWKKALASVAKDAKVPPYTSVNIVPRGGRQYNYDADAIFLNGTTTVASVKLELKKGGLSINRLPEYLTLHVHCGYFGVTYDTFFYESHLDAYLACDPELTVPKPDLTTYLSLVAKDSSQKHPFFAQLKEREPVAFKDKVAVVKRSITDYLTKYGSTIDLAAFAKKTQESQGNKYFLLWEKGTFHIDKFSSKELSDMTYSCIKNGNVIELKAEKTLHHLLLRWKNHAGILTPAWQISMKRS